MPQKKQLWTQPLEGELKAWRIPVRVAFAPDGGAVAAGNGGRDVWFCHAGTGQVRATGKGHTKTVLCTAYSGDGKYVVSGSMDNTVRVWDPANGDSVKVMQGHQDWVFCAAFAPDNRTLATAGRDGVIILWDVPSGKKLATVTAHQKEAACVAFAPQGGTLASSGVDGQRAALGRQPFRPPPVNSPQRLLEVGSPNSVLYTLASIF